MPDLPLVSVGAINYNNARFVIETLESIKSQTYSNIELVIVDDCSTDNSLELIYDWLKTYKGVYKVVAHEVNMGVCVTCNDVLKNSSGKYIQIVATDDILLPEKLSVQVDFLENAPEDVCAVYSDAYLINEDSSSRYGWFIQRYHDFERLPSGDIYDTLISKGNFIPAMSVLSKTRYLINVGFYDTTLPYEDFDMWLRLAKKYKFLHSNFVSVKYRIRENSLTYTTKWLLPNIRIYAKHAEGNSKALSKLEILAREAFYTQNYEIFKELKFFKAISKTIRKAVFFSKFKFSKKIAYRIQLP